MYLAHGIWCLALFNYQSISDKGLFVISQGRYVFSKEVTFELSLDSYVLKGVPHFPI